MKTHAISESKYCSGTCYDPSAESFSVSIRIVPNQLYIDLGFKESHRPAVSISANSADVYNTIALENITEFKQFKELFSILSGHTFDFDVKDWSDFQS